MNIRNMLEGYQTAHFLRLHTPGHAGRGSWPAAAYDVTELPDTDDLANPQGAILAAQRNAAQLYGAQHSFFLTQGSTVGIQAMVLYAAQQQRTLFLPRAVHMSVVNACILAGIQPRWLPLAWVAAQDLPYTPVEAFAQCAQVRRSALLVVYPDYYGRCMPLAAAFAAAGTDTLRLVDQAHGAHLTFIRGLAPDAGTLGAHMWVAGAHKTLPAPTQTALLHIQGVDARQTMHMLRLVHTTSPSFPLLMGLEDALCTMQNNPERVAQWVQSCDQTRTQINQLPGLHCWRADEFAGWQVDPLRFTVDVRGRGISGYAAAEQLSRLGVQVEMADAARILLLTSIQLDQADYDRLVHALAALAPAASAPAPPMIMPLVLPDVAMSLREAALRPAAWVPPQQAAGRIAAQAFGLYPPGVPLCMPGERVPADAIAALHLGVSGGASAFGLWQGRIAVVE